MWRISRNNGALFRRAALGLSLSLLSGCVLVDDFGARPTALNAAAADAKGQMVLANIIRAAYSEPLQFSDFTSNVGSVSAEASLGASASVPTRGGFGTPLEQQFLGLNPSIGGSVGNNFTVNNIVSQEFYNGLQAPITTEQIASLLYSGTDPRVVLLLAISEIEIIKNNKRSILRNDPTNGRDFSAFVSAVRMLEASGFTGELVSETTPIGPPLNREEARELLSAVIGAPSAAPTLSGEGGLYRINKKSPKTRFCFDSLRRFGATRRYDTQYYTVERGEEVGRRIPLVVAGGRADPDTTVILTADDFCGARKGTRNSQDLARSLKIRTRSIDGMFNYLGKLVRMELGLETGARVDLRYPLVDPSVLYAPFHLREDERGVFPVSHRGRAYSVNLDPNGQADGSTRVLQLLIKLLALNSSVKDFPQQPILTVVGR